MNIDEYLLRSINTGLKCQYIGSDGWFKGDTTKDDYSYITTLYGIIGYCYYFKGDWINGCDDVEFIEQTSFKPIVRPLKMLSEPCLKNNLIPAIEIAKLVDNGHLYEKSMIKWFGSDHLMIYTGKCDSVCDVHINFQDGKLFSVRSISDNVSHKTSEKILNLLIRWHFDLGKFVDNGIAIEVTNDFNPYKVTKNN